MLSLKCICPSPTRLLIAGLALAAASVSTPASGQAARPHDPAASHASSRRVAIVLFEGVEILDFAGPMEVFNMASGFGGVEADAFAAAIKAGVRNPGAAHYNLACCRALAGQPDEALDALEAALEAGWANAELVRTDADLQSLRGERRFEEIVRRMESVRQGE